MSGNARLCLCAVLAGLARAPAANAGTLETLYEFPQLTGSSGAFVVAPDGTLYGNGGLGGAYGYGSVFSFDPHGKVFTTLYNFKGGDDAAFPVANMVLSGNHLYGATQFGGPADDGTVFKVNIKTGAETVLYSFSGPDGSAPYWAPALGPDGSLYGTTWQGGTYGDGTVFKLDPRTGAESVIHSFDGSDGRYPWGLTVADAQTIYGTAAGGGANNCGTLYKLDSSTGTMEILYNFPYKKLNGPRFPVILGQDGNIFGMSFYDNYVFNTQTQRMTALHSYDDGQTPTGALIPDQFGNLYATTHNFSNSAGLVFALNTATDTTTILRDFDHKRLGLSPGGVIFGKDGRLFGATYFGGTYGYGTIFAIALDPAQATAANGNSPSGTTVRDVQPTDSPRPGQCK
jgi:uncharacterized repeat protein (TIGR03803 family)